MRECVIRSLPSWIRLSVDERRQGDGPTDDLVEGVITSVLAEVDDRLRKLADAHPTEPMSGPLEQIRQALAPVHDLLDESGVPAPVRDEFDTRARPGDRHGLGPMSFAELGTEVHEAGIEWGAAKAYVIRRIRLN